METNERTFADDYRDIKGDLDKGAITPAQADLLVKDARKRHRSRMARVLSAAALIAGVAAAPAKADVILYVGSNTYAQVGAGVWDQPPLPTEFDSRTGMVGLDYTGDTPVSWLGYSIGVASLGKASGSGYFVDDDSYDRHAQVITYPCSMCGGRDYKYRADFSQETQLIYLTANASYRVDKAAAFIKGGVAMWHATFSLHVYDRIDGFTGRMHFSEWDMSPYAEAGVQYGPVTLSGYFIPKLRGPESAWDAASGVKVGYTF